MKMTTATQDAMIAYARRCGAEEARVMREYRRSGSQVFTPEFDEARRLGCELWLAQACLAGELARTEGGLITPLPLFFYRNAYELMTVIIAFHEGGESGSVD
jgi:hypothetical protein